MDDEYLFSTEELTEREKKELEYKRTIRDLAKDYKKAGAKEQEERKNRYYMPEENRRKVGTTNVTCRKSAGCSSPYIYCLSILTGGATEGPGAGGNPHGAGRRAGSLGGGEAEDGLPQLWGQEGARARNEAGAGEVPADPGGGGDDRLCHHRHYHEGNSVRKGDAHQVPYSFLSLWVSFKFDD